MVETKEDGLSFVLGARSFVFVAWLWSFVVVASRLIGGGVTLSSRPNLSGTCARDPGPLEIHRGGESVGLVRSGLP